MNISKYFLNVNTESKLPSYIGIAETLTKGKEAKILKV